MKEVGTDYVSAVFEQGAWNKAGFKLSESKKEPVSESKEPVKESQKEVEKHVCPLCESELKEAISDERLLECAAEFQEVFEAVEAEVEKMLNEESEEDLEDSDDDEDSDEDEVDEDDDEDEDA